MTNQAVAVSLKPETPSVTAATCPAYRLGRFQAGAGLEGGFKKRLPVQTNLSKIRKDQ